MDTDTESIVDQTVKDLETHAEAGNWLELGDYCKESQFETLFKNNRKIQKTLIKIMDDLLNNSIGDNEKDCFKDLLLLFQLDLD